MENMKQTKEDLELQNNNSNPEGQENWENDTPKTYSEEEYKNAQAFGTKARQDQIAMAEKLVKSNPKELESIDDEKLRNKVIENLYGAKDLGELKIISPEIFEEKGKEDNGDDDELIKLQRKVQLMEYKNNQGILKSEIENIKLNNKDLIDTIPDFEKQMENEMKLFNSDLSVKEKVNRAFKLVAGSTSANWEAYLALQGKTLVKSKADEKISREEKLNNSPLANAFKNSRK